jgi:hypothetical protein
MSHFRIRPSNGTHRVTWFAGRTPSSDGAPSPATLSGYVICAKIHKFGAGRVLWGSDHLTNMPVEWVKYRSIGLGEDELAGVLGGTARAVFPLTI